MPWELDAGARAATWSREGLRRLQPLRARSRARSSRDPRSPFARVAALEAVALHAQPAPARHRLGEHGALARGARAAGRRRSCCARSRRDRCATWRVTGARAEGQPGAQPLDDACRPQVVASAKTGFTTPIARWLQAGRAAQSPGRPPPAAQGAAHRTLVAAMGGAARRRVRCASLPFSPTASAPAAASPATIETLMTALSHSAGVSEIVVLPRFAAPRAGHAGQGAASWRRAPGGASWSARAVALAARQTLRRRVLRPPQRRAAGRRDRCASGACRCGCRCTASRPGSRAVPLHRARPCRGGAGHVGQPLHPRSAAGLGRRAAAPGARAAQHGRPPLHAPRRRRADLVARHGLAGRRVILTVGRLAAAERYKGHDRLIAALPGILARVPDAAYLIVGSGDDRPRLEQLAREARRRRSRRLRRPGPGRGAARLLRAGRRLRHAEHRRGLRHRLPRGRRLRACRSSAAIATAASMRWPRAASAASSIRSRARRSPRPWSTLSRAAISRAVGRGAALLVHAVCQPCR